MSVVSPTLPRLSDAERRALLRHRVSNVVMGVFVTLLIIGVLFPFWWVVRTALTTPETVFSNTSSLFPAEPTTFNFQRVIGLIDPADIVGQNTTGISAATLNFWTYLRNSVIVSTTITFGQVLFSTMAAYAFARLTFPGRDLIFFLYLTGLMVPGIVLFIPNFVFVRQLGWIGTYQGIVAPYILMTPFAVFFMRQFFLSLNKDLVEAAVLDGATKLGVFWRVALPLVQGPVLTLGVLTFIGSWNEYLWPLLVGREESVRVLTVALGIFRDQTPQGSPDWTGLMAGTAVAIMPTLLLFIFLGRRVVDSIQFSGFK
ncbi:MAG: carbohydrate ABC transporter permease [Anaerolineae bacterium]|nr:carbohydrate ABC transporter permease [Chloroflexota bacterium]MBP6298360.1 carbohydrate ABC transporter permease [Anaerolineae bacterium]